MSGIADELAPVLGDNIPRSDASLSDADNSKIILLNAPQLRSFCSNRAVTSNYTPLNFVPLALLQLLNPIEKFANFYFLVVGLMQMIPAITITDGHAGTFMPLSFVLLVDMLMRAIEDYSRHRADDATNTQQIDVLHASPRGLDARWEAKQWHAVAVGDIVRVSNKGTIPADLLLLCASPERGSAWVNTKPLDGESDTKLRESAPIVPPIVEGLSEEDIAVRLGALRGVLVCEQPNDKVNDFSGQLRLATTASDTPWTSCNLSRANMLLRGCQLRNTDAAYGLVVSTGNDCKINFSLSANTAGREKPGLIGTLVNKDIALVTVSLVVTCLIGAAGATYWNHVNSPWYLGFDSSADSSAAPLAALGDFAVAVGRFFLLTYQFIPVSLYVSISVVNTINAYFVVQDISMYDAVQDEPCRVRSMALLEALGSVTHVFSDKTGTLTSNHMELRRLLIQGTAYGTGDTAISAKLQAQGYAASTSSALTMPGISPLFVAPPPDASSLCGSGLASCKAATAAFVNYEEAVGTPSLLSLLARGGSSQPGGSAAAAATGAAYRQAIDFLVNLAVNHSVMIERGGSEELVSSSPDELAFVSGAEYFGIELVSRDMQKRQVVLRNKLLGKLHTVELLEVFPYESSRKRMSVIVRLPEELASGGCREVLYCKGADSVLLERLKGRAAEGSNSIKTQSSSVRASKSGGWWAGNGSVKTSGPTIGDVRSQVEHLEEVLGSWAEVALRTLVFARRELPQFSGASGADRFAAWHEAYVAQRNDAAAQMRMQAELECELTLQGATAIEDKLQDGVPEVLADLRDASVKVWMLTGDKVGTAKNIAAACNILSSEGEVSEFTEETHEGLKAISTASLQALLDEHDGLRTSDPAAYRAKISAGLRAHPVVCDIEAQLQQLAYRLVDDAEHRGGVDPGAEHSLVLDEKAIEVCCLCAPKLLAVVSNASRSVVACRARKDQKARLVSLIRNEVPKAVTLAIGDGANDVAMIKAAHVGVGIIGKEGAQAVNNSDFGVGQFRFLRRLLFVHGRTVSRRLSILVFYIFYKNVIETLVQFWYTTQAGWSGQTPFIQITINWFNMFYTSLPIICFAANDSDLARDHAERIPAAYRHSLLDPAYTHRRFWLWQLEALYFSLACYLLVVAALDHAGVWSVGETTPGTFELGVVLQHVVITTVTLRLLLEVHAFTWLEWFFFIGTVVFWFANVIFFSEVDAPVGTCLLCWGAWNDSLAVLLSPYVVLVQGLTMAAVLAPRTTGKFWNVMRGSTLKTVRAKIQAAEAADCQLSHVRDSHRRRSASVFGSGFAFSVNDESAAKVFKNAI